MLEMSFYNNTLNVDLAIKEILKTNKKIQYTVGLKYKNPCICEQEISKEKAIEILKKESWIDINENDKVIDIQVFNENDMY